jgi:hypothetical protein
LTQRKLASRDRTAMRRVDRRQECKAYMDKHHEQMATRMKERGGKLLPQPRRDACAGLKTKK